MDERTVRETTRKRLTLPQEQYHILTKISQKTPPNQRNR